MFWKNSALKVKKAAIVSGNITKLWCSLLRCKASYLHIFHLFLESQSNIVKIRYVLIVMVTLISLVVGFKDMCLYNILYTFGPTI